MVQTKLRVWLYPPGVQLRSTFVCISTTLQNDIRISNMDTAPPPPYTPLSQSNPNPLPVSSLAVYTRERLQRFLIQNICYAYDVDVNALRDALAGASLLSVEPSERSLLSESELVSLHRLSQIVSRCHTKSDRFQFSGIMSVECKVLNAFILVPAQELGISGEYVFDWLKEYSNHKNYAAKRHQALPYHWPSRDSKQQAKENDQDALEKHLISIDLCVQKISPNEKVRLLLAAGIAKFADMHFKARSAERRRPKRQFSVSSASIALAEEVRRLAAEKNGMRERLTPPPNSLEMTISQLDDLINELSLSGSS